jgi:hypothetical protein
MSEVNILSEIKAVFSFLEENGIESISQLEGKVIADTTSVAYKWDYCISAESLGRFLKDHAIEDQDDFDSLTDDISKTLMCAGVEDFSDVREKLDSISGMIEQAEQISSLCDDIDSMRRQIDGCAKEIIG